MLKVVRVSSDLHGDASVVLSAHWVDMGLQHASSCDAKDAKATI